MTPISEFAKRRAFFHGTYNGGWHGNEDGMRAFHHGMDTVFNALDAEAKKEVQPLSVPEVEAALAFFEKHCQPPESLSDAEVVQWKLDADKHLATLRSYVRSSEKAISREQIARALFIEHCPNFRTEAAEEWDSEWSPYFRDSIAPRFLSSADAILKLLSGEEQKETR